jgi:hypothetical protein
VALAILAGPAASAACLHAMADVMHDGHTMPAGETPPEHSDQGPMGHGDMPPCHEQPAEKPPPPADGHGLHDCASPCCLAEAPVSDAPPVVASSAAQAIPAPQVVEAETEAEPVMPTVAPDASPPPRAARLHAVFQRFLI